MSHSQYPRVPVEQLRHGAVWSVDLEPVPSRRALTSWQEAWDGPKGHREHIVLITAPWSTLIPNTQWAGWWRSRLVVGDLHERSQEAILADFGRLLRQAPPVQRNWRRSLSRGRYGGVYWHLIWGREITTVL